MNFVSVGRIGGWGPHVGPALLYRIGRQTENDVTVRTAGGGWSEREDQNKSACKLWNQKSLRTPGSVNFKAETSTKRRQHVRAFGDERPHVRQHFNEKCRESPRTSGAQTEEQVSSDIKSRKREGTKKIPSVPKASDSSPILRK